MITVEQVKEKLLELDYIREELNKMSAINEAAVTADDIK